jgi:hypothetical protein
VSAKPASPSQAGDGIQPSGKRSQTFTVSRLESRVLTRRVPLLNAICFLNPPSAPNVLLHNLFNCHYCLYKALPQSSPVDICCTTNCIVVSRANRRVKIPPTRAARTKSSLHSLSTQPVSSGTICGTCKEIFVNLISADLQLGATNTLNVTFFI